MYDKEQLARLIQSSRETHGYPPAADYGYGWISWNKWRTENKDIPICLRGADLRSWDLREMNLSGADLRETDLRNDRLKKVDLSNANLRKANLCKANLANAVFRGADLREADLSGAWIYGASASGTDFRGANLTYVKLTDADLSNSNFDGANLTNSDLTYSDLTYATFSGANLTNAYLHGTNVSGTNMILELAESGHSSAQVSLGHKYMTGDETLSKNLALAVFWFQKAAAQGNGKGRLVLGEMYMRGVGVERDMSKAIELFLEATLSVESSVVTSAGTYLCEIFDAGESVPSDLMTIKKFKKAKKLLSKEYGIEVKKEGCFIATAVYGSQLAPEVLVLRNFRDSFLSQYVLGRIVIRLYYYVSPHIANFIGRFEFARTLVRLILIHPVYVLVNKLMKTMNLNL